MVKGATIPAHIGRYEVLEEVGRGAMGVVFRARDPLIGRAVAVKTITTGIADDPDLLERFRREAKAAGGLQHPNIVTIYEMSDSDGLPFIAMEYLEGESLEKVINRRLRMSLAQRLGFVVQACRALDYAHRRGVIHRDIKPGNIMVTLEGVVKVVDFGIARITDTAKTQTGALLGTLSYMSPEQLRGRRADQRSDVWSLGAVLFELLTYRRAFDGENHAAVMMNILQEDPRGIGNFVPECPPELESVLQRALHKDEGLRYQTMEALLVDLEPIWASLQKETVQKLVSQGRQLMQSGKLAEAGEVLRESLMIDTANLTAKSLFDQVNALLGPDKIPLREREHANRNQDREPKEVSRAGTPVTHQGRDGTLATTPIRDPQLTTFAGPGSEKREVAGSSAARLSNGQTKNQPAGNSASLPTLDLRSDRPATVAAGQHSPMARPVPAQARASAEPRGAKPPIDRSPRKRTAAYVIGGFILALVLLVAVGHRRQSTLNKPIENSSASLPAPGPAAPASAAAIAQPAGPKTPPDPVPSPTVSTEDQQRRLIDLAHEAADSRDYKTAQARLDEAARLNGPLTSLIDDLRRRFSGEAHGAQLQQAARKEQSLWNQAMKDMEGDHLDDADKLLRELLTLPEGGHRVADAERYVDQLIPQQRHQDQLWSEAQLEANSTEPGHLVNEVKTLNQLLAEGFVHEQDARQMRDAVMIQFARGNAQRNHTPLPVASNADQAQFSQLEDQFIELVRQGNAQALQQLQMLRPQFKTIADGNGLLTINARDFQNNLIPKAQQGIEDRLAKAESAAAANAAYEAAVTHYDRAAATQNTNTLRSRVLPEFRQIVGSGGPRAPEAARYVNTLIPEAIKEGGAR